MTDTRTTKRLVLSIALAIGMAGPVTAGETDQAIPADAQDAQSAAVEPDADSSAEVSMDEIDWSELNRLPTVPDVPKQSLRAPRSPLATSEPSGWSRKDAADGTSAVSVKSAITPFWDAHVGVDLKVVRPPDPLTPAAMLPEKIIADTAPKNSSGSAWASIAAPGVSHLWDKTTVEARMDPGAEQGKLGATFSKSLPLWSDQFSLTLQNGYRLTEQAPLPLANAPTGANRTLEMERVAKFSINQTGTSLIAGQTLSTTDDRWLSKVGAEQKLFGDISISGTVNETPTGNASKTLSAGFKKTW